ncbi:MAG: competence/damage-inducible protein A, partial [Planctomycetales bacterium]
MRAEVIAIGDELTSGQRVDTNSAWISARLLEIGVPVLHHSTVGDDLDANIQVFRQAIDRADVIVATGGLGPTADDLTRDAVAAAVGAELELHQPSLEHIRNLFARRGSQMPESNQVQAMFPQGSNPIPNPEGTAPGIRMDVPRAGRNACRMVCLPGVPAEMKQMWEATAAGDLIATGGESKTIRHRVIKCFGAGESKLEGMLPDLIQRGRNPSVGITVHDATRGWRLPSMEASEEACRAASASTER